MKNMLFKKLTAAATAFALIGGAVSVPVDNLSLITANAENDLDNKLAGAENEFTAIYDEVRNVLTISGNVERYALNKYHDIPDLTVIADNGTILPEDCSSLFYYFSAKTIDLSNADASNVKTMRYMFQDCPNLTSVDLGYLNTKNVTDMSNMFYACTSLESVDMRGFDTENVKNMYRMFLCCDSLKSLDIGSFNTSNVEFMGEMFRHCTSLENLNISNFETSNVIDMSAMFEYCTNLTYLNISNFDTSKSKSLGGMFCDCKKLESLDLSSFTVNNNTFTVAMFDNCLALEPSICTIDKIVALDGNIGVDFYLNPCEKLAKVVMSGPNGDKEITGFSGVKQQDGTYKFTYSINASQADKLITLKAYDKDGNRLIICDKDMKLLDHSQASTAGHGNIDKSKKDDDYSDDSYSKTDNTNDSKKDPVILIPGIMGSRLFADEECTDLVWPPEVTAAGLNKLRKNATKDILYVKDPSIKQNNLPSSQREYGVLNCMKDLIECLYSDLSDRDIYVFSYDWRKSNVESAAKLNEFINSLNVDKVDIVAHSMGGLVVSWYYQTQGGDKLDKVITCGTPYEGSPHMIEVVEDGKIKDKDYENFFLRNDFIVGGGLTPDVITSFDGVAELLPSPKYCELLPMKKLEPDEENYHSMNADEYREIIDDMFGSEKSFHAFSFIKNIRGENGYNCLSDYENSYYVIGSKGDDDESKFTVESLIFSNEKTHYTNGQDIYYEDIIYTERGDGTVPYHSATMAGHLLGKEYKKRVKEITASHFRVVKKDTKKDSNNPDYDDDPIAWIEDILNDVEPNISDSEISYDPYSVYRVACPVDVEIGNGNDKLSSVSGEESFGASFGRLDIIGKDNDIKMICMDENTNLDINLTGTDTGIMDFTVRHFSADEELIDERTFENIPITNKTIIKTKADNNEVTVLSIDNDGDGVVDATWTAKKNETVTAPDATIVTTTTNISTGSVTTTSTSITTTKATTTTTATADKRIVGSWYVSHVTIKTDSYDFTDDKGLVIFNNDFTVEAQSKITIDSDGKLHEGDEYWTKKGTWAIKGDKYFATPSDIKETEFTYDEATDTISVRLTDAYLVMKRGGKITSTINLGDVNKDGLINAVDASIVLTYYAMMSTNQKDTFDNNQKSVSDVNHDGLINAVDASCILSYYAYISTTREDIKSLEEFLKK